MGSDFYLLVDQRARESYYHRKDAAQVLTNLTYTHGVLSIANSTMTFANLTGVLGQTKMVDHSKDNVHKGTLTSLTVELEERANPSFNQAASGVMKPNGGDTRCLGGLCFSWSRYIRHAPPCRTFNTGGARNFQSWSSWHVAHTVPIELSQISCLVGLTLFRLPVLSWWVSWETHTLALFGERPSLQWSLV